MKSVFVFCLMSVIYNIIKNILPFPISGGHNLLYKIINDYAVYQEVIGIIGIIGRTEVMFALKYNRYDKVINLINIGCNVFLKDLKGNSLIHFCDSVEVLKIILYIGVNVEEMNLDGNTLLHMTEKYDVAEFLINNKADINILNKYENTPLMRNCNNDKNFSIVELLVKSGANINIVRKDKSNAIKIACLNNSTKIAILLFESGVEYDKNELLKHCI